MDAISLHYRRLGRTQSGYFPKTSSPVVSSPSCSPRTSLYPLSPPEPAFKSRSQWGKYTERKGNECAILFFPFFRIHRQAKERRCNRTFLFFRSRGTTLSVKMGPPSKLCHLLTESVAWYSLTWSNDVLSSLQSLRLKTFKSILTIKKYSCKRVINWNGTAKPAQSTRVRTGNKVGLLLMHNSFLN